MLIEQLEDLIHEAQGYGVELIYAISPGLDISYSSDVDMTTLKVQLRSHFLIVSEQT